MSRSRTTEPVWLRGACLRIGWGAAVAALAFIALTNLPAARAEGSLANYEAVAVANGLRAQVISPGAPLSDTIADFAAPSAQSRIDGLGSSEGFASFAYPGDAALGAAPLVAGLALGGAVSPPAYPLIATSSHPLQAEQKVGEGPASIVSVSEAGSSTSKATVGGGAEDNAVASITVRTQVTADPDTGALVAEASSVVDLVTVGTTLRIGRIESAAAARKAIGEQVTPESSLSIAEVSVNGVGAKITDKGLVAAGSETPGSASSIGLNEALTSAGISLRIIEPQKVSDGITAAVLQIQVNAPGGSSTQSYSFGGVSARVSGVAAPSEVVADEGGTADGGFAADPLPSFSSGSGDVSLPGGPASFATPGAPTRPQAPARGTADPVSIEPVGAIGLTDTASFYLALVISALVVLGGGQLIRLVGVKHRWIS